MAYFDLDPLLGTMLDAAPNISDLNLSVGRPPQVEVEGQLRAVPYAGIERLMPYQTELIVMRQSPRGERLTEPTLGPSGRTERLNCWSKNLSTKVRSQRFRLAVS